MQAYIKAISYYLPERGVSNEELVKETDNWSIEKIASKIGVATRHIAAEDEFSSDMAQKAALKLFEEHQIDRSKIDFVLLCTQSPDYFLPTTACILQDKLGLPTMCGAVDFNLGCSGYVYGLAFAKGLITAGISKNILLITSETYTKFIHKDDIGNRTIFGDAAAATIISTEGIAKIGEFDLGTDGKGANNLIVKNGGLRYIKTGNQDDFLYMNGPEIFTFTLESTPLLVANTLKKNNNSAEDIDYYLFHQANRHMLNFLRKKIGIPEDKFVYYMENCGNTVSSTIPIALYDMLYCRKINSGRILLAGFGVGYSWGGTILDLQPQVDA